jgi:hypothetical protein
MQLPIDKIFDYDLFMGILMAAIAALCYYLIRKDKIIASHTTQLITVIHQFHKMTTEQTATMAEMRQESRACHEATMTKLDTILDVKRERLSEQRKANRQLNHKRT